MPLPVGPTTLTRRDIRAALPPFHPFRCEADFEIAEFCINNGLSNDAVDTLLLKLDGSWAEKKRTTFRTHRDLNHSLERARRYVVPVNTPIYRCREGTE